MNLRINISTTEKKIVGNLIRNIRTRRLKSVILIFFCINSDEVCQQRNLDTEMVTTLIISIKSGKTPKPR